MLLAELPKALRTSCDAADEHARKSVQLLRLAGANVSGAGASVMSCQQARDLTPFQALRFDPPLRGERLGCGHLLSAATEAAG